MSSILEKVVLDERLSLKAKGLFVLIYSQGVRVRRVIPMSKDGRDAHYAAFAELQALGYTEHIEYPENPDTSSNTCAENPDTMPEVYAENPEIMDVCTENPDIVQNSLIIPPPKKIKKRLLQVVVQKKEKKGSEHPSPKRSRST